MSALLILPLMAKTKPTMSSLAVPLGSSAAI